MSDKTKAWERYEAGKRFNQRLDVSYYDVVDTNWEMFKGNQYVNSNTSNELPKPIFNIIKRIITFFVAMLTASPVKISFSQIAKATEGDTVDENAITEEDLAILNAEFENFAERVKLQSKVRDSYKDGCITGDFAWHLYFDPDKKPYDGKYGDAEGEICMEIVDGVNVYLANPNNRIVQDQNYVLVTGRDMITDLQAEYKQHNKDDYSLQSDSDTEYQAGYDSRIEIEDTDGTGKATYVIMYEKKTVEEEDEDGNKQKVTKVFATKSLADVIIYENIDIGLSMYPVIMDNWERQKNNYHGLALCTAIIPNQIFINRMFAAAMLHLLKSAFPKAVYDKNRISGWTNRIDGSIGVDLQPGENIKSLAGYLDHGIMSPQIIQMINLSWDYTKETLGANDAMLGDVNPEQASGAAISVTAQQSAIPLTGPRDNMYDACEDLGNIFQDMVAAYYGIRPVAVDSEDGSKEVVMYDFTKLQSAYLKTKVDVGATTPYDEMADRLTAERFLQAGYITFKQLLETYPDIFVGASDILDEIKKQEALQDELIKDQLTPEQRAMFDEMPEEEQEQMLAQFKAVSGNEMQGM